MEKSGWYLVTWKELKVFFAVILYMDMMELLNIKVHWAKNKRVFYCVEMPALLTRKDFWHYYSVCINGSINLYYGQRGLAI